jgi:hypothetical protein
VKESSKKSTWFLSFFFVGPVSDLIGSFELRLFQYFSSHFFFFFIR